MGGPTVLQYQVAFTRDPETASVVAEIPALQIADFGVDVPEALDRLQSMATFHLDCLIQEGKPVPTEEREEVGSTFASSFTPRGAAQQSCEDRDPRSDHVDALESAPDFLLRRPFLSVEARHGGFHFPCNGSNLSGSREANE